MTIVSWTTAAPAISAAFLASLVEVFEAFTIVPAVHRPLARVPENTLKFGVGVMLSAFGVFWVGEGQGVDWPGHDLAILAFALILLAVGLTTVKLARLAERQAAG